MKEIRLHGRGGQGVVKASQIIVSAAVAGGRQGQFIPFFGVERKGSPVFGYLRLSDQEIRRKTQIYEPDMLVIMDDSLIGLESTYEGLKEGGMIVINSVKSPEELSIPAQAGDVAIIGQHTGGGACSITPMTTADGSFFNNNILSAHDVCSS